MKQEADTYMKPNIVEGGFEADYINKVKQTAIKLH